MMQQIQFESTSDQQLVDSVVQATVEVLRTMANMEVEFTEVQTWEYCRPTGDISAIIGLFSDSGDAGMMSISFSSPLAKDIVSRLLGVSPEALSPEDLCDGVRELVNMISGGAKASLSQHTNTLYKLSLPSIILGSEHQVFNRPTNTTYLLIQFKTDNDQRFTLQVALKSPETSNPKD